MKEPKRKLSKSDFPKLMVLICVFLVSVIMIPIILAETNIVAEYQIFLVTSLVIAALLSIVFILSIIFKHEDDNEGKGQK